jgi:hypothetical protein
MRMFLLGLAALAAAVPAAAQPPRPSDEIRSYAPALDRATDALLDIDLGPLLDAVDPYRRHGPRTLRDMARRDDPYFDRRLRASIYGNAAAMGRVADAVAAAQPALRRAADRIERDMADAIDAVEAPPPPPPEDAYAAPPRGAPAGEVDDDWDLDADEEGPPEPEAN